jgi:hypothetical protein
MHIVMMPVRPVNTERPHRTTASVPATWIRNGTCVRLTARRLIGFRNRFATHEGWGIGRSDELASHHWIRPPRAALR